MQDKRKDLTSKLTVKVEKLVYGGKSLGFIDSKAVFLDRGLVGDILIATINKNKSKYCEASVESFIEKTPRQAVAQCSVHELCGGCQWQELSTEQQLEWKTTFVRDSLIRIAKIQEFPSITISDSPDLYNFRSRIQLKAIYHKNGQIDLGYYRKSSHNLVLITQCPVAEDTLNQAIETIRQLKLARIQKDVEIFFELQAAFDSSLVIASFIDSKKKTTSVEQKAYSNIREALQNTKVQIDRRDFFLYDTHLDINYYTKTRLFQQINTKANRLLREYVESLWLKNKGEKILDLFCGSGNLSLHLAHRYSCQIHGFELSKAAIECANYNVEMNCIQNTKFETANVHKLKESFQDLTHYDLLILDPPRAGLEKLAPKLARSGVKECIYISCDPNTLARDLAYFVDENYRLESIHCFDFFKHSYHVETVVHLTKNR